MKYVRRRFKPHDSRLIPLMPHTLKIFDDDRYKVVVGYTHMVRADVNDWCVENLGDYLKEWAYGTGINRHVIFYFTSKDHAMAFKLMWS